jgi:hypothetical protein
VAWYNYVPLADWSPHSSGNPIMLPQGIYMSEIGTWDPRIPLSGLGFVFPSYYYHYLNAILPLPVREDAPVRVYNAYPLDGHVAFPLSPSIYSNPGF